MEGAGKASLTMPEAPKPDYYGLDYSGGQWGEPVLKEAERRVKDYSAQAEEMRGEGYDPETDDYAALRRAGFTHAEIQAHLGPRLYAAGFSYDSVVPITTHKGLPGLEYRKRIGNTFYVVEEIRHGRNELSFTSMWKMDDNKTGIPLPLTPEATTVGPGASNAEPLGEGVPPALTSKTTTVGPGAADGGLLGKASVSNEAPPPALTSETVQGMTPLGNAEALLKNRDLSEVNPTIPISEVKPENSGTIGEARQKFEKLRPVETNSDFLAGINRNRIIPQLIEHGVYLEKTAKTGKLNSHIFAAKAMIDGKPYTVGFVVREDVNGKRYYDHALTEIMSEGRSDTAADPLTRIFHEQALPGQF
ncbi:MAG: hypothetical protein LBD82_08125 [Deltaproteobacteria bacterium]|jgi:hypothetical protein|nr:hypothetical protein [Deltaproteobacteria bacterium]